MTFITGSYPALLGGVSEQSPAQRQPNQVTEQINMYSDPVTGLRRRSGLVPLGVLPVGIAQDPIKTQLVRLAGKEFLVVVILGTYRRVCIYSVDPWALVSNQNISALGYVLTTNPADIQITVHADALYILDRTRVVAETPGIAPVINQGVAQVRYGAFYTTYSISVSTAGADAHTVTHDVPGLRPDDTPETVDKITVAALATALAAKIDALTNYQAVATDDCIYITTTNPGQLSISTTNNSSYMITTGALHVPNTAVLPTKMPAAAAGLRVAVGYAEATMYYAYDAALDAWVEAAAYADSRALDNMTLPVRAVYSAGVWQAFDRIPTTPREAGDATSNPSPQLVGQRLTCMASFQGRLMLCAGSTLAFSASDDVGRWYRRTLQTLRDDDPVGFESSASGARGAVYRETVMFGGNMLLLGAGVQAAIQGATVLTPSTANLVVISQHDMAAGIPHVMLGRSLLYSTQQGNRHAIWEMFPGEYSAAGITTDCISGHLPDYIVETNNAHIHAADTAQLAVVSCGTKRLVMYQYLWENDAKLLSGFHEWRLPVTINSAFVQGSRVIIVDTAGAFYTIDLLPNTLPKLDYYKQLATLGSFEGYAVLPNSAGELAAILNNTYWVRLNTGEFYQPTDWKYQAGTGYYYTSNPRGAGFGGTAYGGVAYESSLIPTQPIVRDRYNQPILLQRAVLHSLGIKVNQSGVFYLTSSDSGRTNYVQELNPVQLYSWDILQGAPQVASVDLRAPLRIDLTTAKLKFSTQHPTEFNIIALEYSYRHTQRFQRAFAGGD